MLYLLSDFKLLKVPDFLKKLRFAYLSAENPENKKVWSGTHYSIYRSLKNLGEVEILGPYEPKLKLLFSRLLNQVYWRLLKKRISYKHSIFISKAYASYFNQKLSRGNFDFIVAPAASGELAFVKTNIPVIYITDGTFAGCLNYHKNLSHLTQKSITEGNFIEQQAINKSRYVIVSSQWCAQSVIKTYKAPAEKVKQIPYGANFEKLPGDNEIIYKVPKTWKILFVGVYWESKGGDIAFNAFKILRQKGYDVSITILGCIPPDNVKDDNLKVIPFIDKNDPDGQKKLFEIYKDHHLLVLPTRFDCTPIVINEASAFGMPCLVSNTGGIEGHLTEGINGFLVDYSDSGAAYAAKIEQLILNPEKYVSLKKSTRKEYIERLNWEHWTEEFRKIINL